MIRASVCWQDFYGNELMITINTETDTVAIINAIRGLTNSTLTNFHTGTVTSPSLSAPTTDPYASVGDVLACIAIDLFAFEYQFMIPAPLKTIFGLAFNSVDTGDADFNSMALEANNAFYVPQSGHPVQSTPKGWLLRRAENIRESYISAGSIVEGSPALRRSIVWGDSFGNRAIHHYYGLINMDAWMLSAQAISNAIPLQVWEGELQIFSGPALAAPYAGVKDQARLTFDDINGNRSNLIIPAPKIEIFLADGKTVDRSNEGVGALVAAVLANGVAPQSGLPLVRYIGGILVRSKAEGLQ